MRLIFLTFCVLAVSGCDNHTHAAEQIVAKELGNPGIIEFRKLREKGTDAIICGEVLASDKPDQGWRHFVAYLNLGRAAISPTSTIIKADAEMGNSALSGAAADFYGACDG